MVWKNNEKNLAMQKLTERNYTGDQDQVRCLKFTNITWQLLMQMTPEFL